MTEWISAQRSRRDALRIGALTIGIAAVGSSLASCSGSGSGDDTPSSSDRPKLSAGPSADGTPEKGGILTVGMIGGGAAESIAVPSSFQNVDQARILNLYDLMFDLAPGGTVTPALIEEATPNADASSWNFRVREGVTWHDGKDLTADDIVWTIKESWGSTDNVFNAVLSRLIDFGGVRKVGPRDVEVPLLVSMAQLPTVVCFYSCAVIQDGTKDFTQPVGTGPFTFESFTPGSRSVYNANPNHWREGWANVDQLVIDSSFSAENARMNALLSGAVDIVTGADPTLVRANAKSGRIIIGNQPGPAWLGMGMRVDSGDLSDERVRQALKLIPERGAYVDTILGGYGTVGNDLGGHTNQYFAEDIVAEHDPEKARSLLKAAGVDTVTLETAGTIGGQNEMATLFATQAKAAGLDVAVNRQDPASFYTEAGGYQTRSFATNYYSTGINSLAAFYLLGLVEGGPYNDTHWGSPADDGMVFDALGELDDAKAGEKWLQVQQTQVEKGGYLIPQNFNWLDAYSPRTRGAQTTTAMNCNNFAFGPAWISTT